MNQLIPRQTPINTEESKPKLVRKKDQKKYRRPIPGLLTPKQSEQIMPAQQ